MREQAERERDELLAKLGATRETLRASRMDAAGESGADDARNPPTIQTHLTAPGGAGGLVVRQL